MVGPPRIGIRSVPACRQRRSLRGPSADHRSSPRLPRAPWSPSSRCSSTWLVDPVLRFLALFRPWVALVGVPDPRRAARFSIRRSRRCSSRSPSRSPLGCADETRNAGRVSWRLASSPWSSRRRIVVTFTRAGLITVASTLAVVAWLRYRRAAVRSRHRGRSRLLQPSFAVQLLSSRSAESLRLRLTTETLEAWFRAEIQAPVRAATGHGKPVGGAGSPSQHRWRDTGTRRRRSRFSSRTTGCLPTKIPSSAGKDFERRFRYRVAPGATIALDAQVEAPPEPGEYRLMWDVEQSDRLWFSTEPERGALYVTRVVVSGPAVGPARGPIRMTLPTRCRAARPRSCSGVRAASLLADAPARSASVPTTTGCCTASTRACRTFDRRVHSNNMYIEMLVGGGLVGGAAFAWLCWAVASATCRRGARLARHGARASGRQRSPPRRSRSGCTAWSTRSSASPPPTSLIAVTLGLTSASLRAQRYPCASHLTARRFGPAAPVSATTPSTCCTISRRGQPTTRSSSSRTGRSTRRARCRPRVRDRLLVVAASPRMVWMQTLGAAAAAAACSADVVHFTNGMVPLASPVPTVVTIHDMSLTLYPALPSGAARAAEPAARRPRGAARRRDHHRLGERQARHRPPLRPAARARARRARGGGAVVPAVHDLDRTASASGGGTAWPIGSSSTSARSSRGRTCRS